MAAEKIQIGDACMIAHGVYISDADWHGIYDRAQPVGITKPIHIKDNVWIGDSAIICKGVTIGKNSIIGAGSVVTKDIPENSIYAGNPAKFIKNLDKKDNTKVYGFNFGYDTRNMNTGDADNATVTDKRDVFFQQVAFNLEAASENLNINSYALIPTGDVEKQLNNKYQGGAMNTYGVDVGFDLTDDLTSSIGYYYQHRDQEGIDGSGVKGSISYQLSDLLNQNNLDFLLLKRCVFLKLQMLH